MRTRCAGAVVVLLFAVALLVPAGASAAETFSFGPGSVTYARVGATHGYRVNFSENEKGYFFVRVKGHGATTDFATHTARARPGRLVADFGKRGRFDLRFVAVGKPEPIPVGSTCQGMKGSWQPGYLVGTARFRTETGYARMAIHRVPAADESWSHLTCEFGNLAALFGNPKEKRTTLAAVDLGEGASSKGQKRTLSFRMTRFYRHAKPAADRVAFVAELREAAGRISIQRKVQVRTGERSLMFPALPQLPEEVRLKPPAPFSGSAELLRTHESTYTWSGDLAVAFPGLGPVRLTGPRFGVAFCSSKACVLRQAEASSASARYAAAARSAKTE